MIKNYFLKHVFVMLCHNFAMFSSIFMVFKSLSSSVITNCMSSLYTQLYYAILPYVTVCYTRKNTNRIECRINEYKPL